MIRIPHLETDITQACQLSCVACNHHVPLYRKLGPLMADPAQIDKDLRHLATFMRADRWGALGGEPLLHRRLTDILKIVRDSGITEHIEVWTNGLLLQQQPAEFWREFDTLVFSRYPDKHSEASVAWIRSKCADEGVALRIIDEGSAPNFKTLLEPVPTSGQVTRDKFRGCFFRAFSRVANSGYFFTCCCAPHMPTLVNGLPFGTDGIRIEGTTQDDIVAYLEREEPLDSCSTCAGRDTAVSIPWSEERNPEAWLAKSAGVTA